MTRFINVAQDGDVALITLNRPDRLNALDMTAIASWSRCGALWTSIPRPAR